MTILYNLDKTVLKKKNMIKTELVRENSTKLPLKIIETK